MIDPLQALLQPAALEQTLFPPNSRYHGIAIATLTSVDGPPLAYLRRRIVPPPERLALLQEHTVVRGDRLDNISAQYFGDPELFWRIADANRAVRPEELTETPGRRLRITLPEGIPGASDA
jgi:hypothetical protein